MAKADASPFKKALFQYLKDLEKNNDRDWFKENRSRYDDSVLDPAFEFISAFGPRLRKISPHFLAIPKASGGSLFRIHRDVRFSKDKRPYKTNVGIHFRHEAHKNAYAPGFYLHLDTEGSFAALGIWHPEKDALRAIRERIAVDPKSWHRAANSKKLKERFELSGDSLKRPPKGFDPDHPAIEDLKRKDFIAVHQLTQKTVTSAGFLDEYESLCKRGAPLMKWLCGALDVAF